MDGFLRSVAQTFAHEVAQQDLQQYAFVFPNRRAGVFFRKYLAEALNKPILSPSILTINECFYELSDLQLADPLELLFRIYDVYREVVGSRAESFDQFMYWGKLMLGDFSEIDNHLVVNVRELFTTIHDLKEIELRFDYLTPAQKTAIEEFWTDVLKGEKMAGGDIQQRFTYVWSILFPVYERLRMQLRQAGLAYDGQLHRHVIEDWDSIPVSRLRQHYVFVGFNALTRSEEELMVRLQARGVADFYFDYRHPWLRDENNRASLFMRHNLDTFSSRYHLEESAFDVPPQMTLLRVPSTVGETYELNRILEELYASSSTGSSLDYTRTAVVLPDERMLLPMLTVIPSCVDKVNVTMGYPVSATPIFAFLRLLETLRAHATGSGFYHKDVIAVLSHRYARQIAPELCAQTILRVREENLIYVKEERLAMLDSSTPTIAYLRALLALIPDKNSEELFLVETALNRIENAIRGREVEEKTIFALINLMIGELTIPYVGEPLAGLQVMGVLETRALDFDNLIIMGFNDDLYPGNSHGNSYIPYTLRVGFGLPTPERQDAIYAYNFYRMLSYASHAWFVSNSRADDQHSGEPSRYLAQLRYQYQLPVQEEIVVPTAATAVRKELSLRKSSVVMDKLEQYASPEGKLAFSPSAINSYLRCPMSFYWKYIAGVKEPKQVFEDLQDSELGTLLHAVMERLYRTYEGKEVGVEAIEQMHGMVEETLGSVAAEMRMDLSELSRQVIVRYAHLLFEHDMSCEPFTLVGCEYPVHMNLPLDDKRIVRLYGVIDRIDRNPFACRLIDYKTGGAELEFENIESLFDPLNTKRNPYALQTILYCIMYGGEKNENSLEPHIYSVRALDEGASTIVHQKGAFEFNLSEVTEVFMDGLRALITEIMNPEIPFTRTADDRNCDSCPFVALCCGG